MDEQKTNEFQEDDLERYGVWVKAGPEEVVEAEEDFSLSDLPSDESSLEVPDVPIIDEIGDDDFDLPEFDDIDLEDDDTPSVPSIPEDVEDDDLVSLDDFDIEEPEDDTDPFAEIETDESDLDLNELNESLNDDFEPLSLDDDSAATSDGVESFDGTIPGTDEELDDNLLDDIEDDSDEEDLPELDLDDLDDLDDEEIGDEHDFTPEDQGIEIAPGPVNQISPEEEEFLAEDDDLQNPEESAIQKPMDTQEREAFLQIQTELTDIKRELAELKEALRGAGGMRSVVVPTQDETPSPPVDETDPIDTGLDDEPDEFGLDDDDEQAVGPGFFEEDDDETIALTGDELDNILNTAEFTEQAGEAAELDDDFLVDDANQSDTDIEIDADIPEVSFDDDESIEDDPAVTELAEMDIDQELSDIDALEDDTAESASQDDEIEIDLDSLDDIEESADETVEDVDLDDLDLDDAGDDEEDDEEDFDSFASAVEQDLSETEDVGDSTVDDIDEIELDDDFEDEDTDLSLDDEEVVSEDDDSEEEIELNLDDLEVEDIDIEDNELEIPSEESEEAAPEDEEDFGDEISSDIDFPAEDGDELEAPSELSVQGGAGSTIADLPEDLKQEIRSVLTYMDQLLEALPDDKIEEFAQSEHFDVYKRLFEELGLET